MARSLARGGVQVEGLVELNRALRDIEPALQKELRGTFRRIGAKVRDKVRASMPSRTGKARSSVRSANSSAGTYIAAGKASVPYVGWLDFGGTLRPSGGRRNTAVRPIVRGGRYLYPAIEDMAPQLQREAVEAIEAVKNQLGLE